MSCKPLGSRLINMASFVLPGPKSQVVSSAKLPPPSVLVPPRVSQSPPADLARIVLVTVRVLLLKMPPPTKRALLPLKVLLVTVMAPPSL